MSQIPILKKLEQVDPREVWKHEANGFTPWLALRENIEILAEELGLGSVEIDNTEQKIDGFFADIVAHDESDRLVLIENQLAPTDHKHLGQTLTYLAGLKRESAIIVWIATSFREPHRAVIDWLNRIVRSGYAFFAVEIEACQIGDSGPAARFNVVAQPNDWADRVTGTVGDDSPSDKERHQFYRQYWTAFLQHVDIQKTGLSTGQPSKNYFTSFSCGTSGLWYGVRAGRRDEYLAVEFCFRHDHAEWLFDEVSARNDTISSGVGQLEWHRMDGKKQSKIEIVLRDVDVSDEGNWEDQHKWLASKLVALKTAIDKEMDELGPPPNDSQSERQHSKAPE